MTNSDRKPGALQRLWRWFWSPSARWSLGALLVAGGAGGIVFWGGFNMAMEATNTPEFCMSCHEMGDNVGAEWMQSTHYKNASGVRAVCSDCHVPKEWTPKVIRKIYASNELYHHFMGKLDTPEKFAANRAEMAERVWASMKANDSHECRNCHSYDAMDFHKQTARGAEQMQDAVAQGKTCIDCHRGIAHKLPPRDDGAAARLHHPCRRAAPAP